MARPRQLGRWGIPERAPDPPRIRLLQIVRGGRRWTGEWWEVGPFVHVGGAYGSARREVRRGASPAGVAERLLAELVKAWLND